MRVHASCVVVDGRGILISGVSGSGKSTLVLELISRGAKLVSDDQTVLTSKDGQLWAATPPALEGLVELSGIGVVQMDDWQRDPVPVAFEVHLTETPPERLPEPAFTVYEGVRLPCVEQSAHDAGTAARLWVLAQACQQSGQLPLTAIAKAAG